MKNDELSARDLTRRLVARAAAERDSSNGAALAAFAASERAYGALARSLGATGFHALLSRALAHAEADHPLLREIRIGRQTDPLLGDVSGIVEKYGASAVEKGLEAALETVFGLLGKLIGDDMVPRLVEQNVRVETYDDEVAR